MKLRYAICSLLLVAAISSGAEAGVLLPGLHPTYAASLASANANTEAAIRFNNMASFTVSIYWIDYTGAQVFYEDIAAGSFFVNQTYLTHPWLVKRTSDGTPLVGFMAQTAIPYTSSDFDIANISEQPVPVVPLTWGALKSIHR